MKRIVTVIVLVCCAAMAWAQNFQRGDNLVIGQRWPTYYYGDWIDLHYNPAYTGGFSGGDACLYGCKAEVARYMYADSSLPVIGIAAAYCFVTHVGEEATADPYNSYQTDYFRLYEVDTATNELVLVAENPLVDTSVACYMPTDINPPIMGVRPLGAPIREVYFDSAITVHDSFYVAVTGNNNYRRQFSMQNSYVTTDVRTVEQTHARKPVCYPVPNHYRRKLHLLDERNYDLQYHLTDTNWHVLHMTFFKDSNDLDEPVEWYKYIMIFPILDTTSDHLWQPECRRPVEFSTIHVGREVVVLGWESEGSSQWELKVAKEGEDLDSVAPVACTSDVTPLYGLDTASWYLATVRSVCGESRISQWSDTLRFFVPGDTTSTGTTEGIGTLVEKYTCLMPNPASEQVTVMSSFRIDRIEIYTVTGRRILQEKVGGLSAQIDLSGFPEGTYLVRTYTNRGVSTKRLIKN